MVMRLPTRFHISRRYPRLDNQTDPLAHYTRLLGIDVSSTDLSTELAIAVLARLLVIDCKQVVERAGLQGMITSYLRGTILYIPRMP
jgi:hypothetical protein